MNTRQSEEDVMQEGHVNFNDPSQMYFNWWLYGKLIEFAVFSNIYMIQTVGGAW